MKPRKIFPAAVAVLLTAAPLFAAPSSQQYDPKRRTNQPAREAQSNPAPSGRTVSPGYYPAPGDRPSILVPLPHRNPTSRAQELVDENFRIMRETSPNPDAYLHGSYNPRYQVVTPGIGFVYPYLPCPPYYGSGYGYGYYGNYYSPYGGVSYGVGAPVRERIIQQREVYVYPGGAAPAAPSAPQPPAAAPAPEAPAESSEEAPAIRGNEAANEDFYLRRRAAAEDPRSETIDTALDEIRKAWLNGDYEKLAARYSIRRPVRVYLKGDFRYEVMPAEFLPMLRDAMKNLETVAFDLDRPRAVGKGKVFVSGAHSWLDESKKKQTTHISYGLELNGGRWIITEVGSSSGPITAHHNPQR